jgi:hypothetical protein
MARKEGVNMAKPVDVKIYVSEGDRVAGAMTNHVGSGTYNPETGVIEITSAGQEVLLNEAQKRQLAVTLYQGVVRYLSGSLTLGRKRTGTFTPQA